MPCGLCSIVPSVISANRNGRHLLSDWLRVAVTKDYAKGCLLHPGPRAGCAEARSGAGGKLVNFYFTTGDSDFLLITETDDNAVYHRCVVGSSGSGRYLRRDDFKSLDWCRIQGSRG